MCCGTLVDRGLDIASDEHTNIPNEDWNGCDVKIVGGFSSDFDLCEFHGAICNACVKKALPNLYKVTRVEESRIKYHYKRADADLA